MRGYDGVNIMAKCKNREDTESELGPQGPRYADRTSPPSIAMHCPVT